jgi:GT2 family glycosyltransferase
MPSRVHALLVVRPEGRAAPDIHLRRTLTALAAQSRQVDALTIVICGDDRRVRDIVAGSGAEGVIAANRGTRFADALRMASHRLDGDAVWLLAQDTAPEPDALARLAAALETAPSVAFAAPKLVRWDDPTHIVSLGVTMTRGGRSVGLADDEHDQGQHDAQEDVLGADVRGVLVRADAWRELGGLDPALGGADEGLDLGVRARLAGGRVALAPTALISVAGDGVAGASGDGTALSRGRAAYAARSAQLHRRLVYAAGPLTVLHWVGLLPLAIWRSLGHLLAKRPELIGPELAAAVAAAVRVPAVMRSRGRIRSTRRAPWSQLASLRIGGRQLRHRLDDEGGDALARPDLHFFSSTGGAWIVLAALVVSLAAYPALLTWPVLGGGALAPLRTTVSQLWSDAASGARPLGWSTHGPADPFSALVAVLGTLSPAEPSRALVVLWLLALPLAALGGWFAATRLSEKPLPRAVLALGWMLAPTFLTALVQGRPAGVIVHLILPWLLFTASVAHRSWTGAAVASLALVAVVACAPSLAPALVVLWLVVLVLTVARRGGRGLARVIWLVVPTIVVWGPLVWHRLATGDGWALLADPGVVAASQPPPADLLGRLLLAAGFPTADIAGWAGLLPDGGTAAWFALLVVPLGILALAAPLVSRLSAAIVMLVMAALGAVTAMIVAGMSLSASGSVAVPLWAGAAASLLWAGLIGSAVLTLDGLPDAGLGRADARGRRIAAGVRAVSAAIALAALVALAVPALTALHRGDLGITNGPDSTLPAYVDAEGRGDPGTATFVMHPQPRGGIATEVVWGGSATLGGQTTLQSVRRAPTAGDEATAAATADLVTGSAGDIVARLGEHGIAYVLLDGARTDESDAARATRLAAKAALDRRDDLESVGDTGKGELWVVIADVSPRTPTAGERANAWRTGAMQFGIVVVALLLAVPTAASLRQTAREPRIVGGRA